MFVCFFLGNGGDRHFGANALHKESVNDDRILQIRFRPVIALSGCPMSLKEINSIGRRNKNQPIWKENDAFIVNELDLQHIILLCVPTEDIPRHLSTMHERWITQVQLTQLPVEKTTQWPSVILQKMLLDPTKGGATSLTQPAVTLKSNILQGNGKLTVLANC